jgi:DNA-binding GntR family transcriptional regulator
MILSNHSDNAIETGSVRDEQRSTLARARLVRDLFNGGCSAGEWVKIYEIASQYQLDESSVIEILRELQILGMVSISKNGSAVFHLPNPKKTQEAYQIRAVLEEVGGRAAARSLKGNTSALQREIDTMHAAVGRLDLDSFVEHDIALHRIILQASQNEVLLRVWESLAIDLRTRGVIKKLSRNLPEVVESHQPIVAALEKGQGREAGLLLRNHVETLLEF